MDQEDDYEVGAEDGFPHAALAEAGPGGPGMSPAIAGGTPGAKGSKSKWLDDDDDEEERGVGGAASRSASAGMSA